MKVPKEQQFVHENKVPATVSKELWEAANLQISKRRSTSDELERGKIRGNMPYQAKLSVVCAANHIIGVVEPDIRSKNASTTGSARVILRLGEILENMTVPISAKLVLIKSKAVITFT